MGVSGPGLAMSLDAEVVCLARESVDAVGRRLLSVWINCKSGLDTNFLTSWDEVNFMGLTSTTGLVFEGDDTECESEGISVGLSTELTVGLVESVFRDGLLVEGN